jgi:AraC-like DNA-binding protein
VAVMLDELAALRPAPLSLSMPRDPRLLRIAMALDAAPGDNRSLADWAAMVGVAPRTATRRFAAETGLGFRAWRQRLRLLKALEALSAGQPVATTGYDLGYDSPSAFTAMFRRATGAPPSRYAAEAGGESGAAAASR